MRSMLFKFLSFVIVVGFFTPAFGANNQAQFVPGEVLVKVHPSVTLGAANSRVVTNEARLQTVLDNYGATNVENLFPTDAGGTSLSRTYVVTLSGTSDVLATVDAIQKLDSVISAQPNYVMTTFATPTDTSFYAQWGLSKIQGPAAWDIFNGSDKVVVAVVDSGVDWAHQDLAANIWTNTNEVPNNEIDDDHNGFIDDIRGWDCVRHAYGFTISDNGTIQYGQIDHPEDNNPGNDPNDPIADHGTHVAGIIGAVANNTVSGDNNTVGVLWNCKIMAVRAGDCEDLNPLGIPYITSYFDSSDIVRALRYAADNGAQVINMSYGGSYPSGIEENALNYAYSKGVVLCAAAGNSGDTGNPKEYPAGYNHVIAVAATDPNDQKASFSQYGTWVDIAAPGTNIFSTLLNNTYDYYDGTSMASPMVAGLAGLIIGYGQSIGKQFTPGQVEYILKQSADNLDAQNSEYVGQLGAGRVNAAAALALAGTMPSMVSKIRIELASDPSAASLSVNEFATIKLQATAVYTDGTTADITDQVSWSVRPYKYGQFSTITPGQFNAAQVPATREVSVLASYDQEGTEITEERVLTIVNDPNAAPLSIEGSDQVDPGSSSIYLSKFMDAEGTKTDVTEESRWDIVSGAEYATIDPSQPGVLQTTGSSGGKTITLRVTYIDQTGRDTYQQTKQILVRTGARQVTGLYITAANQLASGSGTQLVALLFFDQNLTEDVTAYATWMATPASAGSFISPGYFAAAAVTTETPVTLTAQYTYNGQTYTASLTTKVIPAVPQGIVTINNDNTSQTTNTNPLLAGLPCALPGMLVLGAMLLGAVLLCGRQD